MNTKTRKLSTGTPWRAPTKKLEIRTRTLAIPLFVLFSAFYFLISAFGQSIGGGRSGVYSGGGATTTAFQIGATRGSNSSPAFNGSSNKYTVTGSACIESNNAMTCSSGSGTNSFTPTTALSFISSRTYQIDAPLSAWTAGTFTIAACGATTPTISPSASGDFRAYLTCSSTANLVIALGGSTQTMTFGNLTVERAAYDPNSSANIPIIVDNNSGLTTPLTVYQPCATVGWTFQEYVIAAYSIVDKTCNGTDTWYFMGTAYQNSITFPATRGAWWTETCYIAGYWDMAGIGGSTLTWN